MRVTLVALVCGAVVAASSAQAGPTLTKAIPNEAGAAPPVELTNRLRSRANLQSPSRSAIGGYAVSVKAEPIEET